MPQAFDGAFADQPFGLGTPVAAVAPPKGEITLSRFIDPVTSDFAINEATGHLQEMPSVRQRFLILASTILGSSSVLPNLGIDLPVLIDDTFARRVDVSVRASARHMTDVERVARIDRVVVDPGSLGRVAVRIEYFDFTLGQADSVTTP